MLKRLLKKVIDQVMVKRYINAIIVKILLAKTETYKITKIGILRK